MNHHNNMAMNDNYELEAANDAAFRDNRGDIIQKLFPNLTQLEKYALATALAAEHVETLAQNEYSEHFNLAQVPQAVTQYLQYLNGREKWEQRKMDEANKVSVLSFYGIRAPR